MSKKGFSQYNETDPLRTVVIGRYQGYREVEEYVEIVNRDQERGLPRREELKSEFDLFGKTMADRGVEVLTPDYVGKFVYDQLTPRDIGFVVGEKLVLCNMAKASRRYEVAGIFGILGEHAAKGKDILIPDQYSTLLEGGDVMVDKGMILIGISQRSNNQGVDFLKRQFGSEYDVVPVHCTSLAEGQNVLHLDCTFNPVGKNFALIYPPGFEKIPDQIKHKYEWIEVNAEEQQALATNVLSLDESTVISRKHSLCDRVNKILREKGLEVIELPFDGAPSTGGSFRCCTMPLFRETSQA